MGRSLSTVTPDLLRSFSLPGSVYNQTMDCHFKVFARDGKLFQSEFQTASDGSEVFRNTYPVDFIVGGGANGYSAIVRRGDFLLEAPLSFYTKTGKWDLSPGYQFRDNGFNRPILAGCISCHSGRARPTDPTIGKFEPVPFEQLSVGCENCHGPGQAHVRAMAQPAKTRGSEIVNPGRLSAALENEICMGCHEAGDARVPLPGKNLSDIRPGKPMGETVAVLMVPPHSENPRDTDHVQHYFQMSMSKCYRATAGQLRCATCHDPHIEPTAAEAPAYFNAKCMSCHTGQSCKASAEARHQTTPADNCIGCHMPQRNQIDTPHTSLTNHRIVARSDEPWPDSAFQLTSTSLPDLIYLNRPAAGPDRPPALTLLEAYRQIMERKPEYRSAYLKTLAELEQNQPDNAQVQLALGRRDYESGATDEAIAHLQRAVQLDASQAMSFGLLSETLASRGRLDEAIAASEKAVSLDPFNSLYRKALIQRFIASRQYDKALAAMERYITEFPEDGEMRKMLAFARQ